MTWIKVKNLSDSRYRLKLFLASLKTKFSLHRKLTLHVGKSWQMRGAVGKVK